MAAAEQLQGLKDEATCSVCLDYFTKPVWLECGHNFCTSCVDRYLDQADGGFSCPQCRTRCEQKNLRENRQLANMVEIVKQLREPTVLPPPAEALCPEHDEKLKLFCEEDQRAICVVCSVSQQHKPHAVVPIDEAFREYKIKLQTQLQAMKRKLQDILEFQSTEKMKAKDMENKAESQRKRIKLEFEELLVYLAEQHRLILTSLNEYEHEILLKIEKNVSQLEEQKDSLKSLIPEIEDKFQQPPSVLLKDVKTTLSRWENMKTPKPDPVVGQPKACFQLDFPRQYLVLWKMLEVFKDKLSGKLGKFSEEIEWRKARCFAVNVSLDPESASSSLTVSTNGKTVKHGRSEQEVPNNPKRFMNTPAVLGCEGFTSGKYYWEVEVESSVNWQLGVCDETVRRRVNPLAPDTKGLWIVGLVNGQLYWAPRSFFTLLNPVVKPRIVGVYLDDEAGKLSFYNVSDKTHLHTFAMNFTKVLWPYFRVQNPSESLSLYQLKEWE